MPATTTTPDKKDTKKPLPGTSGEGKEVSIPTPATIVVTLPEGAKLMVDDVVSTSAAGTRVFSSPALEAGKDYYYTLKGEIARDGRTITTTEKVRVRAGQQSQVTLKFNDERVAAK
jgi:uncharacterized protein (TIGR03000 family)